MQIKILEYSSHPLKLAYTAARTCYSQLGPLHLHRDKNAGKKKIQLINAIMKMGHHSILEHICITFGIEGVSRALTHQLVRHRLASYSQQSQRYVKLDKDMFDFVIPQTIKDAKDEIIAEENGMGKMENEFTYFMGQIKGFYELLTSLGVPPEDARYILPNACCTNITMTVNVRELIHMCKLRLCNKAQWEIRDMFSYIIELIKNSNELSFLYRYLLPKCKSLGYCPEGKKSCGMMETEILKAYTNREE